MNTQRPLVSGPYTVDRHIHASIESMWGIEEYRGGERSFPRKYEAQVRITRPPETA